MSGIEIMALSIIIFCQFQPVPRMLLTFHFSGQNILSFYFLENLNLLWWLYVDSNLMIWFYLVDIFWLQKTLESWNLI